MHRADSQLKPCSSTSRPEPVPAVAWLGPTRSGGDSVGARASSCPGGAVAARSSAARTVGARWRSPSRSPSPAGADTEVRMACGDGGKCASRDGGEAEGGGKEGGAPPVDGGAAGASDASDTSPFSDIQEESQSKRSAEARAANAEDAPSHGEAAAVPPPPPPPPLLPRSCRDAAAAAAAAAAARPSAMARSMSPSLSDGRRDGAGRPRLSRGGGTGSESAKLPPSLSIHAPSSA